MFRFAGYELDEQLAELRGPGCAAIRLRPKTFEMLRLFVASHGRVLSKEELMEAVWPNVHVGEDSLFQCIRELRNALGDDRRQLIRLVSGRGYVFTAEVEMVPADGAIPGQPSPALEPAPANDTSWLARRLWAPTLAGLFAIAAVAVAAASLPSPLFEHASPTVAVMPIVDASADATTTTLADAVTGQLIDGFAQIDGIRVLNPSAAAGEAPPTDLVIRAELERGHDAWTLHARIIKTATGEVQSVATASIVSREADFKLLQSRLAAGVGDPLARQLNALLEVGQPSTTDRNSAEAAGGRVVIEQATASINQTSHERFAVAQTMLEDAIATAPDNVELQVALAGLQLRGIQMLWYTPPESAAAKASAKVLLERALALQPGYIPVLEAHCRFLSATNHFTESLVACAKALSHDPWDGQALYLIGLGQLHLGRFEDALATFEQAERYDTPVVSRWTWLLGAGWANLLLGRNEAAVEWLQRSIAVTPASGRSYMLLAAAYQRQGLVDEARAAIDKAIALRPGSSALNVKSPTDNASPVFIAASDQLVRTMVEAGLPER